MKVQLLILVCMLSGIDYIQAMGKQSQQDDSKTLIKDDEIASEEKSLTNSKTSAISMESLVPMEMEKEVLSSNKKSESRCLNCLCCPVYCCTFLMAPIGFRIQACCDSCNECSSKK